MFPTPDENDRFYQVYKTYEGEFGLENIVLYLPKKYIREIDRTRYPEELTVKTWKADIIGIQSKFFSAHYIQVPETEKRARQ